jgi:pimeloyl-ACP methyl ester carboxylesterase
MAHENAREATAMIGVAGGALNVVSAGAGPALVLLHGWTLDARMWAPQLQAFAADHLVIAPDRRGFGRSTAPPDLALESQDVIALLDHFGAERAVLVGMSQAGWVALDAARNYPERVAGLVLQGARFGTPQPAAEIPIPEYATLIRAGRLAEMKRRWREHPLMHTEVKAAHESLGLMLAAYEGRDLLAARAPLPELSTADLAAIHAPTLIVIGANDTPARHAAAEVLANAIPGAGRVEIADAGHLCNLCQPEDYNRALAHFLISVAGNFAHQAHNEHQSD